MSHESADVLRPYEGPGREPKRMDLPFEPSMTYDEAHQAKILLDHFQTQTPTTELPLETLVSSPAPENPEQVTSHSELERDRREFQSWMEKQKAEIEALKLEAELNSQIQALKGRPRQEYAPVPLPPGVRPDQNVTVEQFTTLMQQVVPALRAEAEDAALRAQWSVTSEQEQAIREKFPQIQSLPPLDQTKQIAAVAKRLYPAKNNDSRGPSESRPIRVTPLESTSPAQSLREPESTPALQAKFKEYAEASKERNPRLRVAKLRTIAQDIARLQGLNLRLPPGVTSD